MKVYVIEVDLGDCKGIDSIHATLQSANNWVKIVLQRYSDQGWEQSTTRLRDGRLVSKWSTEFADITITETELKNVGE